MKIIIPDKFKSKKRIIKEINNNPDFRESLERGRRDYKMGRLISHKELLQYFKKKRSTLSLEDFSCEKDL